jgi:hypothetical protein
LTTDENFGYVKGDANEDLIFRLIKPREGMEFSKYDVRMTEHGLLPILDGDILPFNIWVYLATEQLQTKYIKKSNKKDELILVYDGSSIDCFVTSNSAMNRFRIKVKMFSKFPREKIAVYFNKNEFLNILNKFCGEAWLGIGKFGIAVCKNFNSHWISYILKAKKWDDEF